MKPQFKPQSHQKIKNLRIVLMPHLTMARDENTEGARIKHYMVLPFST
jgi:hypothetical protein